MRFVFARALSATVLVILTLLVIASIAVPFFRVEGGSNLSTSEEGWEGASDVLRLLKATGAEVSVLTSSPALLLEEADPGGVLFISLGPQREYSLTETIALRKLEDRGGRLLIADDSGMSSDLAHGFGVTMVKGQLYDSDFVGDPDHLKFGVSTDFFEGFILMNRPGSMTFTKGVALVASSSSSWVDLNGNGWNDNLSSAAPEAQGVRYLCVASKLELVQGEGAAVFISDPSMFMNGMLGLEGNREFVRSLVEHLLPEGGRIVIDDSVHDPPLSISPVRRAVSGMVFITTDINMKIVVGTLITVALLSFAYLYTPPERPEHICLLDRTGVAELAEPDVTAEDATEVRKVLLDRVRLAHGLSTEAFSRLSWKELDGMVGDRRLARFARTGNSKGDLSSLVEEVGRWQRK